MTERRRMLIRVAANYAGLLIMFAFGLMLVPLLLSGLGTVGFGIVALLGASVGLGEMIQGVVRRSMIRELGAAYHHDDDTAFERTYNTALVMSSAVAFLTFATFGVILLLLVTVFDVPEDLLSASCWFLIAKAIHSFFYIVFAPPFNMYLVTERMAAYNFWTVVDRGAYVGAAALLVLLFPSDDPAFGLMFYGFVSSGLSILAIAVASIVMMCIDRRTLPRLSLANRADARAILKIGGWNAAIMTAVNMHLRLDAIIINLAFGPLYNALFGFAMTTGVMVRRLAAGATQGLDAVSARLSSAAEAGQQSLQRLVYHSTRLHSLVAFPACVGLFLLAEPFLTVWVGQRIVDPAQNMPPTVLMLRILVLGVAFRSISDGWIAILYGAGHIHRYAPLVLAGGLLNPVIAVVLIWLLPDSISYTGPVIAFSLIFLVVHMAILPAIGARLLDLRLIDMLQPTLRPLAISLIGAAPLVAMLRLVPQWNVYWLVLAIVLYGGLVVLLSVPFVLHGYERQRLASFLRRFTGRTDH